MPEAQAAAGGAQREQGSPLWQKAVQGIAIYMGIQMLMKQFMPKPEASTTVTDAAGNTVKVPASTGAIPAYQLRPDRLDEGASWSAIPQRIAPMWPEDSHVDIIVTVSPSYELTTPVARTAAGDMVLDEKAFRIGDYKDRRAVDTTITVPRAVQNNGTLFGHFYVGLAGSVLDPLQAGFDPATAYHFAWPLTQYVPKKKVTKTKNLLAAKDATTAGAAEDKEAGAEEAEEEAGGERQAGPVIANYYHPNTSLSFIPGTGTMAFASAHPATRQFIRLEATGARDGSGQNSWYYPVLFVNSFWQLKAQMTLLNETVATLPLHIDLANLANWKFSTMATIEASSRESARQAAFGNALPGGGDGSEMEMIKDVLLDTNPILLAVTALVTVAHLVLETLAFGSDIAHYRKKKDNVGISVRSILANVFMQTVILLYLVDNSQNTSWMILGSQAVGILIELWKITTIVNVRLRDAPPGSLIPLRIVFEDKHALSETEQQTKEYDEIAFKYMYIAGVPLLAAYAAYSVIYDEHKSWYSYIITTLVGSVYAYGFLMMVPSLYINYRLKSVAHMPAKAMMYKCLNTFIDDLFAFTIKMPFLHRLATFRDDIIFFIYVYQRWAYRIDYSRVNEFGQGGGDDDEADAEKEGKAKATKAVEAAPVKGAGGGGAQKATGADTGSATKRK